MWGSVSQAIIIITDGNKDDSIDRLDVASWPLRGQTEKINANVTKSKIRIMAISIGDRINVGKLQDVVTPPLNDNVFLAADFDDMYNGMRKLAEESCTKTIGGYKFKTTIYIII